MTEYRYNVDWRVYDCGPFVVPSFFGMVADVTGRHVNAAFVRMCLIGKGYDTVSNIDRYDGTFQLVFRKTPPRRCA